MIKKYQVTVTRTDIYNVEIDDEVFNAVWAKEFSSYMWDIDPENASEEAAKEIAIATARQGKSVFIEGFGIIPVKDSEYTKYLKEKGERVAEGVTIEEEDFHAAGWKVKPVFLGNPMSHDRKHLIINNAFQGLEKLMAMINRDNNNELIQAIQMAAIRIGDKGFRKDKSQEKSLETDSSLPYELRTDATDAYDTNLLGCLTMPYDDGSYRWA